MQKFVVGLTGPTGAGKSTALVAAGALGFFCIDADKVARKATEVGSPLLPLIEKNFKGVLNNDGSLNRAALAAAAFKDTQSTEKLNAVMLPYISKMIENIIDNADSRFVLLDAPTLFEAGADRLCDVTVGVLAPKALRLGRIMTRDGIDEGAATLRINAGKPDEFYKENCDYILENGGTAEEFLYKAEKLFKTFTEEI